MFVVLSQWILKFERAAIKLLCPLRLIRRAENPAAHILGFQHEDAEGRDKHMVDLRGAIWRVQGDIVHAAINAFIQPSAREQTHLPLADMSLGPGRFEQSEQHYQGNEPGQGRQEVRDEGGEVHFSTMGHS